MEQDVKKVRAVLGESVKRRRKEMKLTQADLAERLAENGMQTHSTSIAKIEAGTRGVTVDELVALGSVLGWEVSVDSLLTPMSAADSLAVTIGESLLKAWAELIEAIKKHDRIRGAAADVLAGPLELSPHIREELEQSVEDRTLAAALGAVEVTQRLDAGEDMEDVIRDLRSRGGEDVEHQEA